MIEPLVRLIPYDKYVEEIVPLAIKYVRYSGSSSNLRNLSLDRKRGNIGLGLFPGMPGLIPTHGSSKSSPNSKTGNTGSTRQSVDIQELLNADNVIYGATDVPLFKFAISTGIR